MHSPRCHRAIFLRACFPHAGERDGIPDNKLRVKLPVDFDGGRKIHRVKIMFATDTYAKGEILP